MDMEMFWYAAVISWFGAFGLWVVIVNETKKPQDRSESMGCLGGIAVIVCIFTFFAAMDNKIRPTEVLYEAPEAHRQWLLLSELFSRIPVISCTCECIAEKITNTRTQQVWHLPLLYNFLEWTAANLALLLALKYAYRLLRTRRERKGYL